MTTTTKYLLGAAVGLTVIYLLGREYQSRRDAGKTLEFAGSKNKHSNCDGGCGGSMNASGSTTNSSANRIKCPGGAEVGDKGGIYCNGVKVGQQKSQA